MKIIDLLNKIANGDEIPKKIKYDNKIWIYDICEEDYNYNGMEYAFYGLFANYFATRPIGQLKDEVEIIEEEKKIPEKLDLYEDLQDILNSTDESVVLNAIHKCLTCEKIKINEIIDYLKSKGDE